MFGVSDGKCLDCSHFPLPSRKLRQTRSNASQMQLQKAEKRGRAGASVPLAESSVAHRGSGICRAAAGATSSPVAAAAVEAEVMKDDLAVSENMLPGGVVELKVKVPQKQVAKAWSQAIKFYAKNLVMEGFRKGKKVPDEMIVQKVGRAEVTKEALNQLMMAVIPKAVEDYRQTTYSDSLAIEDGDVLTDRFDAKSPFNFTCQLTMVPKVGWKGDYKDIEVEVDAALDNDAILKAVQKKIWASLKSLGSLRVASQRGVQMGDVAVVDFVARRKETGDEVYGSRQMKMHLDTTEESPFAGLEKVGELLEGATIGETKSFGYKVPDNYWEADLRGADLVYEITVLEILARELPELTDEVAKQLNSECSGVEDLTKRMEEAERMEANFEKTQEMRQLLCQRVAELVDVDVPEFYFYEVASNEYQMQLFSNQAEGRLTRAEVEELATEAMLEKFMTTQKDLIMERVKMTFGMDKIFEEQKLSVSDQMLQEALEEAQEEAKAQGGEQGDLDPEKLKEQVMESLKGAMTLDWLVSKVKLTFKGNPEMQKMVEEMKLKINAESP